ncbi:precorrin-6Y C5,15-methyltransferase (decarboxylating) subunit CbiT [Alkaliphilus pronyensis]|uniref:Precorrin-6Y C5,15-methyltransferase (Decarboxylating) subunit CbiT n=1 Tax=Alkaliphilus pronyensis TaxID=1482732 RepID=A0A6I0FS29_9FIRM|nr:precorrin-6Y C5,15-methyltransferase (decarboxylating) subunit CbiT [Alkaliphilus pronyensis]KAB3539054.1 precorrin-6Y C5,15-methyltransferase (decarboxylating) subunit CbiT [Alkaliphilus pronyensis]
MSKRWSYKTYGVPDSLFIRGEAPMTKSEVRSITLSKLRIKTKDIIVDIGAGTGSISIECGLVANGGRVYAVERDPQSVRVIKENAKAFGVDNIEIIEGTAPEILNRVPKVNRAIIGGSGGKLDAIFQWFNTNLIVGGRVVMNFITLENMCKALELLKTSPYKDIDVAQIHVARGKNIGSLTMMEGHNPVYIISATKER